TSCPSAWTTSESASATSLSSSTTSTSAMEATLGRRRPSQSAPYLLGHPLLRPLDVGERAAKEIRLESDDRRRRGCGTESARSGGAVCPFAPGHGRVAPALPLHQEQRSHLRVLESEARGVFRHHARRPRKSSRAQRVSRGAPRDLSAARQGGA